MISNTDSTLLIYSAEHMRVKAYTGRRLGDGFSRRAGMHRLMRFWRVRFRWLRAPAASALRRGQGLPSTIEKPVPTFRWCSGSSRNAVRLPFGTGVQLRRNPHLAGMSPVEIE